MYRHLSILITLYFLLLFPVHALAAPDEVLHALGRVPDGQHVGEYRILEIDLSGPSTSVEVTLDNSDFVGESPAAFLYDGTDYYMATWDSPNSRIYVINASTGDCTLIDETNVGFINNLVKHPTMNKVFATFDEDTGGTTVDSFGEIDLSDGQVATNTIETLQNAHNSRIFRSGAAFDAFGNFLGSDNSGATNYLFRVDLSDGAVSPTCGCCALPCWKWSNDDYFQMHKIAFNPDTNEAIYAKDIGTDFWIYRFETVGLTISIQEPATIIEGYHIIGLSYTPNVQSEDPGLTPDEKAAILIDTIFLDPSPTPTP
jgi:hypothetical protein